MTEFQTDALRPASLPTASLGRRIPSSSGHGAQKGETTASSEDLDRVAEEWNARIDKEMKAMSGGLGELVDLADITQTPSPDTAQINALHLKLKTSQLIRSAQSIRDIAHELKLMLLLSDPVEEVRERDKEVAAWTGEVDGSRRKLARMMGELCERGEGGGDEEEEEEEEEEMEEIGKENTEMEVDPTSRSIVEETIQQITRHVDDDDDDDDEDGFEQVA